MGAVIVHRDLCGYCMGIHAHVITPEGNKDDNASLLTSHVMVFPLCIKHRSQCLGVDSSHPSCFGLVNCYTASFPPFQCLLYSFTCVFVEEVPKLCTAKIPFTQSEKVMNKNLDMADNVKIEKQRARLVMMSMNNQIKPGTILITARRQGRSLRYYLTPVMQIRILAGIQKN